MMPFEERSPAQMPLRLAGVGDWLHCREVYWWKAWWLDILLDMVHTMV